MYRIRKFIHSFLRREEMKSLVEVRKRLKISSNDLGILKEQKFQKLFTHASKESPYYSKIFQDLTIDSIRDLKIVPILTKELLKEEYLSIISESDNFFLVQNSTSGSTGESTLFGVDSRSMIKRDVYGTRGYEMTNSYRYLDKLLVFWGAERDIVDKKDLKYFYNYYIKKHKIISTYYMTEEDIKRNISFLNKFNPKVIVGYPSALNYMADYLAKNPKVLRIKPNAIISSGEMLYDVQRENIEKNFGVSIFNDYGCREVGHIATECSAHSGLHYDSDRLIIEIVNDKGDVCPPNTIGNIIITDLDNYAFPLIRYKIGDMGSLSIDSKCECGSTLPKLEKVEGRAFDIIKGINGNSVSGTFWTLTFRYSVNGIDTFQVRQKAINELELRVKVNNAFDSIQKNKIIELVKEKLGKEMLVNVIKVDDFEYSPTGKFKWITSDLNTN